MRARNPYAPKAKGRKAGAHKPKRGQIPRKRKHKSRGGLNDES